MLKIFYFRKKDMKKLFHKHLVWKRLNYIFYLEINQVLDIQAT